MKSKDLHDLIAAGEGYHLELKENVDKNFMEEVCAFANSSGGKIIVGVSDTGTIKGCLTDNRSRSLIQDTLRSLQPGLDISVEVFDDRVVISNPGGLPGGLKPQDFGKKSVARNQAIATLLHRAHFIEKVGTGINRIRQAVEGSTKTSVDFSYDESFFTVLFTRIQESSDKSTQSTTQSTTQRLTDKQLKILRYLEKNPGASRQEIAEHLHDITVDGVKYNLKRLQDIGVLKRTGPDFGGHWEVIPKDDKNEDK